MDIFIILFLVFYITILFLSFIPSREKEGQYFVLNVALETMLKIMPFSFAWFLFDWLISKPKLFFRKLFKVN